MKTKLFIAMVVFFMSGLCGCTMEKIEFVDKNYPSVSVVPVMRDGDLSSYHVVFTPSEDAEFVYYLLADESERENFENGTADGIMQQIGNEPFEIIFENVSTSRNLTVFAQAFNDLGGGPIASARPYPVNVKYSSAVEYVTHSSAAIQFDFSDAYMTTEYYLGKPGEASAFLSGDVEISVLEGVHTWTENFFGLNPQTDYVFYVRATDRKGGKTPLIELPFRTFAEGECPAADFKIDYMDVYGGSFRFIPNEKCGKIVASTFAQAHGIDPMLFSDSNGQGDILEMLPRWHDAGIGDWVSGAVNGELKINLLSATVKPSAPMEFYVVVYDKDYKPFGCYHYEFNMPEGDKNAPLAEVDIRVGKITAAGAEYEFTADENTVLFFYETIEADWFDEFVNDSRYHEYFMHEYYRTGGGMLARGVRSEVFIEAKAEPDTRYYASACAMNRNGLDGGWSPLVLSEYTTLSE